MQVPFLGWLSALGLQKVVDASTRPVSAWLMGRTGEQFFLNDGTPDQEPLLVRYCPWKALAVACARFPCLYCMTPVHDAK